jgi:D-alanyl-D-alanine carboxypeptidase
MSRSSCSSSSLVLALVAAWGLAPLACTTTGETPAPPAASPEPSDAAAPERSAECIEEDEALRAALAGLPHEQGGTVVALDSEGCGARTMSTDEKRAPSSALYRVGSVTKTYVAAAVLKLTDERVVSLDDALSRWVPGVAHTDGVTLRHLLGHTSGIFNYTDDPSMQSARTIGSPATPRELVALAEKHEPYFAPGADFRYSNTNYILLGMVLEAATGKPLAAHLRAALLAPAGLAATFLDGFEPALGERAHAFAADGEDVSDILHPTRVIGAGAMLATASDLTRWIASFGEGAILSESTRTAARQTRSMGRAGYGYGLGMIVLEAAQTKGLGPAYGHTGEYLMYRTAAFRFPEAKVSFVVLTNEEAANAERIMFRLLPSIAARHAAPAR